MKKAKNTKNKKGGGWILAEVPCGQPLGYCPPVKPPKKPDPKKKK
jgi:hypothetical protein